MLFIISLFIIIFVSGTYYVRAGKGHGDNFLGIKLGLSGFFHKHLSSAEPS